MKKRNLLKRIAVLAMVGAMSLTSVAAVRATTTTAYAQEVISVKAINDTAKMGTSGGYIRSTPSTSGAIINVASGGTTIKLSGRVYKNGAPSLWYQVNTVNYRTGKQAKGYICSSTFATTNPTPAPTPSPKPAPTPIPAPAPTPVSGTFTVSGVSNFLAVRTSAAYNPYNIIGQLNNGDTFTVQYKTGNGYAYGYSASGITGFVNASYLR